MNIELDCLTASGFSLESFSAPPKFQTSCLKFSYVSGVAKFDKRGRRTSEVLQAIHEHHAG